MITTKTNKNAFDSVESTARNTATIKLEDNAASRTHYETLEVAKDASPEEVRQNYRRLILLHHPDKQRASEDNGLDKHAEALNVAYAVLSDAALRADYDSALKDRLCEWHSCREIWRTWLTDHPRLPHSSNRLQPSFSCLSHRVIGRVQYRVP